MRSILRENWEASRRSVSTLLCQPVSTMVHSHSIKSLWRPLVHVIKTHNQNKGRYPWYTGWAWSSPRKAFQTEPGLPWRSYLPTASHMLWSASRPFLAASFVNSRQGLVSPIIPSVQQTSSWVSYGFYFWSSTVQLTAGSILQPHYRYLQTKAR